MRNASLRYCLVPAWATDRADAPPDSPLPGPGSSVTLAEGFPLEASKPKLPEPLQLAIGFAALVVTTSSMEAIWYLGLAQQLYAAQIGAIMNVQFDVFVAALFYLVYSLGAIVFAVRPALTAASWRRALLWGGYYGFFCFSAHNLTDLADVKGYSWQITVIDIAWGTFMSAAACLLSYSLVVRARGAA